MYLNLKSSASDAAIEYSVSIQSAASDYRISSSERLSFAAESLGNVSISGSYRNVEVYLRSFQAMVVSPNYLERCANKIKANQSNADVN